MSRIEQIIDDIETFINGCKMVPLSSSKIAVNKELIIPIASMIAKDEGIFS